MPDEILLELEEKMEEVIEGFKKEINKIRTGRANPALVEDIKVEYYGVLTPLKQISSISVQEGTQLYIKPYDRNSLKDVNQAVTAANLGINPQNDGTGIRLVFPKLTEDRRKELVKEVSKHLETFKVHVRNIRRDGIEEIKKEKLPEDNEKLYLEDIQKLTDEYIKNLENIFKDKEKELLTI